MSAGPSSPGGRPHLAPTSPWAPSSSSSSYAARVTSQAQAQHSGGAGAAAAAAPIGAGSSSIAQMETIDLLSCSTSSSGEDEPAIASAAATVAAVGYSGDAAYGSPSSLAQVADFLVDAAGTAEQEEAAVDKDEDADWSEEQDGQDNWRDEDGNKEYMPSRKKRPRSGSSKPFTSKISRSSARAAAMTSAPATAVAFPLLPAVGNPLLTQPSSSLTELVSAPPHLSQSDLEAVANQGIVIPRRCYSWVQRALAKSRLKTARRPGKHDDACSVCGGASYRGPVRTSSAAAVTLFRCDFCRTSVHAGCVALEPLLLQAPSAGGSVNSDEGSSASSSPSSSSSSSLAPSVPSPSATTTTTTTLLPQLYQEDGYACPRCARVWLFEDKLPFPPQVDVLAELNSLRWLCLSRRQFAAKSKNLFVKRRRTGLYQVSHRIPGLCFQRTTTFAPFLPLEGFPLECFP